MYSKNKILATFEEIVAGSKTIQPYVIIAQPRRDLRDMPAQSFNTDTGIHIDLSGFSHAYCDIGGELVDVARNYLIESALESKAKYMFFIGEDTVIPYDGFRLLHETAEKNPDAMVAGVYYLKTSSPMIYEVKDNYIKPANVDPGQILEVRQIGMDALLIPTQLLQNIKNDDPEIPFCCIAAPNTFEGIPFIGEDNFFVHRWHKKGYRILVNTDVQCLHCDLMSGKYTAHPSIKLEKYITNFPMTTPLTWEDKKELDKQWTDRLPVQHHTKADALVFKYCKGRGIELGATASNPFPLNDCLKIAPEGSAEHYKTTEIDLYGDAENIPVKDNSIDYIISSHVLAHVPDLIGAFLEFNRVLKKDGIVFSIFPRRNAKPSDIDRELSTIQEFEEAHKNRKESKDLTQHIWVFDLKSMINLIDYCNITYALGWMIVETEEVDSKKGNGHTVICRKVP